MTSYQRYIESRILEEGNYIINTGATVRDAAKVFRLSKSTIHKDITEKLPQISLITANKVQLVLNNNKAERHIRGGKATKNKYKRGRLN